MKQNYADYESFLASPEWQDIRDKVVARAAGRCQICNSSKKIQVHHRSYHNAWGEEDLSDLIAMCSSCHFIFHASSKVKSSKKKPADIPAILPAKGKVRNYKIVYKDNTTEIVSLDPRSIAALAKNPLIKSVKRVHNNKGRKPKTSPIMEPVKVFSAEEIAAYQASA